MRQRKADNLTARRANALLLLDDGLNCKQIAKVLYIDAETVRLWRKLYENQGIIDAENGLELKNYSKREGLLTRQQEGELIRHFTQDPARSTHAVRTFIEAGFGARYAQSGAIKLMHRLGFCYKKPKPLALGPLLATRKPRSPDTTS